MNVPPLTHGCNNILLYGDLDFSEEDGADEVRCDNSPAVVFGSDNAATASCDDVESVISDDVNKIHAPNNSPVSVSLTENRLFHTTQNAMESMSEGRGRDRVFRGQESVRLSPLKEIEEPSPLIVNGVLIGACLSRKP